MYAEIANTLQNEIASFLDKPAEEIDPHGSLMEMGIDSLQMLQLLVLLERNFSVHMDENDLEHFTSVHTVDELAVQRLSVAAAEPVQLTSVLATS